MDSYIIIPATTPFCDIVTIALQRLGYSSDISNTAKGEFVMVITICYCCAFCSSKRNGGTEQKSGNTQK
jgi:hypothetical protein